MMPVISLTGVGRNGAGKSTLLRILADGFATIRRLAV